MEHIAINNINIPKIGFGPGICGYSASYTALPKNNILLSFSIRAFNKLIRLVRRPFQERKYINSISSALQSGFTLLDYSAAYGDGSLIRKGIEKAIKRSGSIKREDLILTTRVSNRAQFAGSERIDKEFKSQISYSVTHSNYASLRQLEQIQNVQTQSALIERSA